jgi:hypothetical protein
MTTISSLSLLVIIVVAYNINIGECDTTIYSQTPRPHVELNDGDVATDVLKVFGRPKHDPSVSS